MSENSEPLLRVEKLTKRFPGVVALKDVDLALYRGEALAVIGENGAGKSTLMKILAGILSPDSGEILIDGELQSIDSVHTATALGISLIHQELNLSDNLDIGANIFLGREPRRLGFISRNKIDRDSINVLDRVGLEVLPRTIVSKLSIGQQQIVEIAKALSVQARILIMDEPTSSLSQRETERLYQVIRDCRSEGMSLIFISHRLGEVKDVADRVLVLRDGTNVGELSQEQIGHDAMVRLMVGRDLDQTRHRQPRDPGEVMLEAVKLVSPTHPNHAINLTVRRGEIVGIAGLVGAGRTEVLETLFGVTPAISGTILIAGEPRQLRSPEQAIAAGMALVPEDRKNKGLILEMALRDNLSLPSLKRDAVGPFINRQKQKKISDDTIQSLSIRALHDRQIVRYLSGGNQQKVVIGKWLALEPKILLLDEPTRGIDVGSKREVYLLMEKLAEAGVAILFVSSEMEEILSMSDRVLVIHEGRVSGEIPHDELSEEAVMQLAIGKTTSLG